MWDCENCGCQAIAGDIASCPMCGTSRPAVVAAEEGTPEAFPAGEAVDTSPPPKKGKTGNG